MSQRYQAPPALPSSVLLTPKSLFKIFCLIFWPSSLTASTTTFLPAFQQQQVTRGLGPKNYSISKILKTTTAKTTTTSTKSFLFATSSSSSPSTSKDQASSISENMKDIPLAKLTNFANSYAAAHGLQVETKETSSSSPSSSYQCAPISLLPNIFPAQSFEKAKSLAPDFNLLVDRISRNGNFLNETLAGGENGTDNKSSVIAKDSYTKKLLQLYNDIYNNKGEEQQDEKPNFADKADRLGIQRSDYMLNPSSSGEELFELKQVELNTIASSFAALATNVAKLHGVLTKRYETDLNDWIIMNKKKVMGENYSSARDTNLGVQYNPALERLPFAMKLAHERYIDRFIDGSSNEPPVAVLFIVQDGETNTVDQRMLEFKLWEEYNIPVVRMSLTKAFTQLKLDAEKGSLHVLADSPEGEGPILYQASLVYYRAGYAPTDYPDGDDGIEWKAREMIERSVATKCPSLGYHLAGTKKIQQELARPGVLEQFFEDGTDDQVQKLQRMRDAFAGLYSLGDDAVEEDYRAISDAISGAEGRYVLKPQREGGGYNYYGEQLAAKIKDNVKRNEDGSLELGEDLAEFILMQRLFPPKQRAVLLRAGMIEGSGESISELGCFGTILQSFDGETTLHNEYAGFLLRTKFENVDEGGVASGFATLSSPYLC